MIHRKFWLTGAAVAAILGGWLLAPGLAQTNRQIKQEQRQERRELRQDQNNYWRYHQGRWNYWNAADKRWYYTDGQHWYAHNGTAWEPYRFNGNFGREGFVTNGYTAPAPGTTTVVVPTHPVYVAPAVP